MLYVMFDLNISSRNVVLMGRRKVYHGQAQHRSPLVDVTASHALFSVTRANVYEFGTL